jgi:parvulin-like peptidyl-prolyl isomerase
MYLVETMVDELGWDRLQVTIQEARQQYDTHPEQYFDPEKLRLQHIFLRAEEAEFGPQQRAEVRARLEEVRQQLLAGADFTAMARQYSESGTAQSGGWMVLKRGAPAAPAFVEVAWELEINEISEVVDTPNGFHVMTPRERFPALERDYESVKEFARKRALTEKRKQVESDYVASVGPRYNLVKAYHHLSNPMVEADEVLISCDGFTLTMDELIKLLPPTYLNHLYNHYFPKVFEYLDETALNRLLLLEAEETGLKQRPDVVRRLERITDDVKTEVALEQRLQDRVYAVPEDAMREYFQQNEQRYLTLREFDLSVILLPEGENLWQTLKLGEELAERIRGGEDFAELARQYSIHYTAANGGSIVGTNVHVLARRLQSTAKFRRVLSELEPGEVAPAMIAECYDPDLLQFMNTGVLVFRLDGSTTPEQQSFEDAELLVRANYLRRNYSEILEEVRAELLESLDIEILHHNLPPL